MIHLKNARIVAKGGGRSVYNHPNHSNLLIKIFYNKDTKAYSEHWRTRPAKRRYGPYREWYVEYEEYIALLNRMSEIPDFIAPFHGFCQTDLGIGQVVEKICDHDTGLLSQTIAHSMHDFDQSQLAKHINIFFDKIADHRVIVRDLNLSNLLIQRNTSSDIGNIICIDGLGDFTFFQIRKHSSMAHRHWVEKARKTALMLIRRQ